MQSVLPCGTASALIYHTEEKSTPPPFSWVYLGKCSYKTQRNSCWCCKLGSLGSSKKNHQHWWRKDLVGEFPSLSDSWRNLDSFPSTSASTITLLSVFGHSALTVTACIHPFFGSQQRKYLPKQQKQILSSTVWFFLKEQTEWESCKN